VDSEKPCTKGEREALLLTACELGLGSYMHALHIPLTGTLLSLNQCFILSRAYLQSGDAGLALRISLRAAAMKSLAPGGKRLRPMLALSAQGGLYSLGCALVPTRLVSALLGAGLMSLWSFIQALLFYWALYGSVLPSLIVFYQQKLEGFGFGLSSLISLALLSKVLCAVATVFLAQWMPLRQKSRYEAFMQRISDPLRPGRQRPRSYVRALWRDLTRPLFLLSLVLVCGFLYGNGAHWESLLWILLRSVGVCLLLSSLLHLPLGQRIIRRWSTGCY
jgi:hypothetical protein